MGLLRPPGELAGSAPALRTRLSPVKDSLLSSCPTRRLLQHLDQRRDATKNKTEGTDNNASLDPPRTDPVAPREDGEEWGEVTNPILHAQFTSSAYGPAGDLSRGALR